MILIKWCTESTILKSCLHLTFLTVYWTVTKHFCDSDQLDYMYVNQGNVLSQLFANYWYRTCREKINSVLNPPQLLYICIFTLASFTFTITHNTKTQYNIFTYTLGYLSKTALGYVVTRITGIENRCEYLCNVCKIYCIYKYCSLIHLYCITVSYYPK
jgi:hypothetical protein